MGFKIQNNRSRKREPMSEINVTPFVDVMLVLLIIFMVTAPMLTAGVAVNLPDSSANSLPDDKEPLTLSINAKGETFIQETQVEIGQLVPKILAMSKNRTCSVGQACFGNILCAAAAPFLTQTVEKSSITCGHTCLRPLSSRECAAGSSIGAFDSLPNCLNVDVGELCESNGECGDAFTVNNCPGGKDVFMRVDECTHTSNDSITTTGFETASENQNQTATIESSNEPSPNESTEHQNSEKGGNDSLINSWWRDEISAASIMSNALLQYSFYILRILLNILT